MVSPPHPSVPHPREPWRSDTILPAAIRAYTSRRIPGCWPPLTNPDPRLRARAHARYPSSPAMPSTTDDENRRRPADDRADLLAVEERVHRLQQDGRLG